MQNLNSIERFLFTGEVYLLVEKKQDDNSRNAINAQINQNIQNQFNINQSKIENDKEYSSVPLKLLCSILNLYFYSNNPKKAYDTLIANGAKEIGMTTRRNKNNLSRVSSLQSGSIYLSDSNLYGDNDLISGETQAMGLKSSRPKNVEDFILIKLSQSEIYLVDYNLEEASIEYKHKESGKNYRFKFKHSNLKEKNYIKIMVIVEAYKYSIKNSLLMNNIDPMRKKNMSIRNKTLISKRKNTSSRINYEMMTKSMSNDIMNTEFIIHFLDNLIQNKFKVLIIDDFFFHEEQNLLKIFTNFLVEFKEMKLKINLYEEEESSFVEDNMVGGEANNKETYVSAFSDRFNLDSFENKPNQNNFHFNENNINNNVEISNFKLLVLDASYTYMNDKGFNKALLPLIQKSPALEKLLLNNNYLTDDIFNKLNELNNNYNIKVIDLSYNKIKGDKLSSNLRSLITSFFELEFINLKGNLIPTSFINKFNPIKFNNLINNIRKMINEDTMIENKTKIKIDLRENLIDIEKIEDQFYLWQSQIFDQYLAKKERGCNEDLEDDLENENEESLNKNEEEMENKNANSENEYIFNESLYNTNNFIFLFDYPYKGPNFINESRGNKKIKKNEFSIEIKKLIPKKNINVEYNNDLNINSLEYYRGIFKFLFLIDYYFDPILNSFSHTYSAFIQKYKEPLSPSNEFNIFENQLKKYLSLDNNKMDLYKDSLKPKYKNIIKTLFTGTILYITKNISDKLNNEGATNYVDEGENGRIPSKYDYKEIPLYEAKEIYYSYKYYSEKYESIFEMTKVLFHIKEKDLHPETGILFNPNSYIKHLFCFYKYIMSLINDEHSISLLLSTYNKLISRIKIECHLAYKERDIYSLKILSSVAYGLGLKPFDVKTRKKYELLKIQSSIIDEGLENLINFIEKEDITMINSYYDIFMTEANSMNYQSELTFIGEYIQFLRNNLIRKKIYEEIYDYQNSNAYITKVQNDFDDIYIKYIKISQILTNQIPENIVYKDICIHPSVLDYLQLSLMDKEVLKKDLETITNYINVQNDNNVNSFSYNENISNYSVMSEYGIRNIYNRLTFLFMKNTKKEYPNKYGYTLSKKNKFLKLARLLFRFYNGLDGKNIYFQLASKNKNYRHDEEKDIYAFESVSLNPSLYNIVYCISNFNTNIKTQNKEIQRLNKEINSGIDVIDNIQRLKLEILKFSPKKKVFPLIDLKSELKNMTKEKRKIFQKISYKFYSKLLEINNNNNVKMIYYNRMYRKIKELIRFILNIKNTYGGDINENFLMIIYKEIFYICLKYMNRENFNFTIWAYENDKNNNMKRFSFGILYIILFYLEFNLGLKIYIKEFLLDLYIHRYFPSYCKNALFALNNSYRYDWVMSAFEIHNRLFNKNKIEIKIYFTYNYYEKYYIDEHTTVYNLFLDVFNNSKYFQNFKDKKLYWIYLVENDPLKDELLPDSIKEEYEQEINEIYSLKEKEKNNDSEIVNAKEENNKNKHNSINVNNNDTFNKTSMSLNNSTIMSNTNINSSETKKKENKYKIDDEYLQYLIDNKGFNKGMFSLHPELDNFFHNNLYDSDDSEDNIINNMKSVSSSKEVSNTNKNEEEEECSSNSSFSESKTNENKNKNANKEANKIKQKKEKIRDSVYGSIVDIKEKEKELNYNKCINRNLKRINLKSNEFVLEFLGNIEEKLHIDFADNLQAKLLKNNGQEEDNVSNSEENDEENSSNSNEESEKEEGAKIKNAFESPNKVLPDEAFKFDLIFNYFHFQICRRFYKQNYLNEDIISQDDNFINHLAEEEQNNIFELISKYFTYDNRNNVVKYDMGKKLGILLIANMRLYNKEIMRSTKLIKYKKENLYLFFFPKKILIHSAFKNVVNGLENLIYLRMKSTVSQNNLEQEFIKSCMNYKEFYSSIYENVYVDIINNDIAKINGVNEDLDSIHLKFANICVNFEGISILERTTYQRLMFFDYSDIVKIYLKNEYTIKINVYNESKKYPMELKLHFVFNYDEESLNSSSRNRKKKGYQKSMNYNEFDAYFLYEDIISFIQFNLLLNTQTKIVQNPEDFNFIYLKNNKYQKFGDIKKLNDSDIRKFKISKQNNDFYTYYKKSKSNSNKKNDNIENEKEDIEKKEEIEEAKEKDKDKDKDKESKVLSNKDLFHELMKQNPKVAIMNEIREQQKENEYSKKNSIRTKHKVSSSSITNNENDVDDFFSDVKVTNLYDNIEKKKEIEKQEKMEKMKKKTFNIESLLKQYEEPEDIMKELEEEQKRWEAKVNSSASSFSLPSMNSKNSKNSKNNKKNEYTINLYNYNNMNKKEQKHFIVEKQLEKKIDETKMLLKDRDLVSSGRKKELMEERKKKGETNSNLDKDDKSMSTSTYLSFLSKNQRYPY